MEAEERPSKLRKLSRGSDDHEIPLKGALPMNPAVKGTTNHIDDQSPGEGPSDLLGESNRTPQEVKARSVDGSGTCPDTDNVALSKNQLKKLRKKQEWEAGREQRKIIRKRKNQEKKARHRAARDHQAEEKAIEDGIKPRHNKDIPTKTSRRPGVPKNAAGTLLPITLIIDCGFDSLMHEREHISLASQITRAYSDNHRAPYKAHLVISSWGGELKTRFDTVLNQHYKNWKDVKIFEEDFVEAATRSKERMLGQTGGQLAGALSNDAENTPSTQIEDPGETIYLTSDSDNTLERLKPHSTYIIGGLVDKNRHKGVCYKSACDRGIKTAKLPIGNYMDMQSRFVLATNHVVEIMIRWLECGDWGEAFLGVMPKRKGGKLKPEPEGQNADDQKKKDRSIGALGDFFEESGVETPEPCNAQSMMGNGYRPDTSQVQFIESKPHEEVGHA